MNPHDTTTDNDLETVARLALAAAQPADLAPHLVGGIYPPNWAPRWFNLEEYQPAPFRVRAAPRFRTTESFVEYLRRQDRGGGLWSPLTDPAELPTIYTDPERFTAEAILDDNVAGRTGWREHRAHLKLAHTPEWSAWVGIDREFMSGERFAEYVEDWRHTIAAPATADLVDIARSFRATRTVEFRDEIIDQTGDRRLAYEETTTARAGRTGELDLPAGFTIVVPPFAGADPVAIDAAFRYRIDGTRAVFGLALVQPALAARQAFDVEVAKIAAASLFVILNGAP